MASNMPSRIQTFVIFDLEGTGLPSQPADYPVRIMELSMVAVQRPTSSDAPQVQRQHLQATGRNEVEPLSPNARGLITPKRTRREGVPGDGRASRSRARPRLAIGTPPPSDDTSTEESEDSDEHETPCPVPTPPRIRNSLLLAVSPRKPIPALVTDLTELDNALLEPHSTFDRDLAEMLRVYLNRLPAPVCLVAHNGFRYDFPLLKAELLHVDPAWLGSSELLCVDSLSFFRAVVAGRDRASPRGAGDATAVYALDATTLSCGHDPEDDCCIVCNPGMWLSYEENDTNADFEFTRVGARRAIRCLHGAGRRCVVCDNVPHHRRASPRVRRQLFPEERRTGGRRPARSMTLPDVYRRRFGVPPEHSHSAADDVEALLLLCLSHGERFFDWADRNHRPLRDVKEMWARSAARARRTLPVW